MEIQYSITNPHYIHKTGINYIVLGNIHYTNMRVKKIKNLEKEMKQILERKK